MSQVVFAGVTKSYKRRAGSIVRPRYPKVLAIDDISLTMKEGSTYGVIGPNGAGKSTLVKLLTGVIWPDSGNITVRGLSPQQNRMKLARQYGAVFGQRTTLWWNLPVKDTFDMLRVMYRIPRDRFRLVSNELVSLLDVGSLIERPVRQLSLGQRMRMELICALLHEPPLLLLDEPTIGLDVVVRNTLLSFLSEYRLRNRATILLTSNNMRDVESLCDSLFILHEGKLIYDGPTKRLAETLTPYAIVVAEGSPEIEFPEIPGTKIQRVPGGHVKWLIDSRVTSVTSVVNLITTVAKGWNVQVREPDLEDQVMGLFSGNPGDV